MLRLAMPIVLLGVHYAAAPAFAGERMPLDRDSDGIVTRAEAATFGVERFRALDTDGDRLISQEEMLAGTPATRHPRVLRRFAEFDADQNGFLSPEEIVGRR